MKNPKNPEVGEARAEPLREKTMVFYLKGISPLMMNPFRDRQGLFRSTTGQIGIPTIVFRNAMTRVLKTMGLNPDVKNAIYVEPDGTDRDGTALVNLNGKPVQDKQCVLGCRGAHDIRVRTRFDRWSLTLRVRYDRDKLSTETIAQVLRQAGGQVGIMERRPSWGLWKLVTEAEL